MLQVRRAVAGRRRNVSFFQRCVAVLAAMIGVIPMMARAQLSGDVGIHDPSSAVKIGSYYYVYGTGPGVIAKWSSDRLTWHDEKSGVFPTIPAWQKEAVPSFTGFYWAPDIAYFNGRYHLYYSVSNWGTITSAIGVATSRTLDRNSPDYGWIDLGKVVQSESAWDVDKHPAGAVDTTAYNSIDPSILVDTDGKVWMAFGSYSSGILVTELDPATGKRKDTSKLSATLVANNAPNGGWGSSIEAAALIKHGKYYYLMVNYGGCCSGVNSSYNIRVGRGTSPTGPFYDKNGVDMVKAGGTMFLQDIGNKIGPGHFSLLNDNGQDYFGYHYYDGTRNGAPTYDLRKLYWTSDGWPCAGPVNPGTYKIIARHSDKALDAYQNGTTNGTQIVQWPYGGGDNQKWTVVDQGGWYSIIGVQSGKSLDFNKGSPWNGAKVQLRDYTGGTNQQFTFAECGDGYYRLTPNHAMGSCLDVEGISKEDGANIQLWSSNGLPCQQWSFQQP